MRTKARRSLEAARLLLARGFVDEAASRFYFALFQAGVHALERQGKKPADFRGGATYREHRTVARHADRIRGVVEDEALFDLSIALRQRADYNPIFVNRRYLHALRPDIERFVLGVTG
ncbi:MAG TPA: hypothetical protein VFI25_08250 [Planctomycetota bacterium]|jgi:uncharacterized protein (UPF0332 family)|nr:hypothetical protein [Planctomycetota bacterium]